MAEVTASRLTPLGKPYSELKHIVNADGQNLYCKYWEPESEPVGLVLIVHGMGEHCERYDRVAGALTKRNMLVFAHDHVGHGQSEGTRLDVKRFQIYVRDVLQHIDLMKKKHPKLPLFIIGHSMGGTIAVITAYERSSLFTGVVLSSPAIELNSETATPFKVFMAKMVGSLLPQLALGNLNPKDVSRNQETVKSYEEDPLVHHGGIKARIAAQTLQGMERIKNGISDVRWPFLVQHGDHDKMAEVSGSRMFYEKAASEDKTLTVYEGCYHELDKELEEDAARAVSELEEWIVKRLPTQTNGTTPVAAATDDKKTAATDEKEPAATDDKEPAVTDDKEPAATDDKEPAATDDKEPAATDEKEPAATDDKEPAATDDKEPAATDDKEPAATGEKEPAATDDKEPATGPEDVQPEVPAES